MGMPGYADVKVSTVIDSEKSIYSKNIQLIHWMGLNGLALAWDYDKEINGIIYLHKIMKLFIGLPDGIYRITKVKQPTDDPYDYEWEIVNRDYDDN